ncbi:MAG: hypothetical protein H3C26_09965 [Rhodocyclaceae bacterium]|nr:hypothetical protein [Rhodocyclaceae bacterium]
MLTQKAASSDAAAAADKAAGTITQGDITIVADATTTAVSVKQDAAVTAVNAAETTGGVTESASVKFSALTAGQTIILGGLTLTADVAMTANEVAAAFANLVNGAAYGALVPAGDTQSGALATKGTYTGVFTGWTSGAASGDTVVFTSTTANSDVGNLANTGTGTATVTTTAGKAHDATPAGGKAGIVAGAVAITGGAALKTVTVDGYATGLSLTGGSNTALDTISLANGANATIASAASTLALVLKNVNGTVNVQAGTTTLNADVSGTGTAALKSASATAVNVSGSGSVSGTTTGDLTAATSISTAAFTGTATFTLDSTATSYTGGAGKDIVTFSNSTAATKAIDLGAGDDTLVFAGTNVPTVVLKGGEGTDTISLAAADAVTLSGATTFASKLDSFERLVITGATGAQAINVANLGFADYVTVAGVGGAGTLTLNDLANNGTVVLNAAITNGVTVNVKDAAAGTADVLNVVVSNAATIAGGKLTAANVETINLTATDSAAPISAVHTLTLAADAATSATVKGNAGLTLTLDAASNKLATIDASALTGALTAGNTLGAVAMTITGGSGNDVLTASSGATAKADVLNGGAGNDTLIAGTNGAKLTGGAGNDLFVVTAVDATSGTKEANTYSTILDFSAGDLLKLEFFNDTGSAVGGVADGATGKAASFAKLTAVLDEGTAVFANYVTAAMEQIDANSGAGGDAIWFSFKGDSYVVVDSGAVTTGTFANGEDLVIKLTGVDLTNASWNATQGTIALV